MAQVSHLDRRSFLQGAGAAAGVLAASAMTSAALADEAQVGNAAAAQAAAAANQQVEDNSAWMDQLTSWRIKPEEPAEFANTYEADVVVVGAGLAGINASRAAAEAGASVITLEDGQTFEVHGFGVASLNPKMAEDQGLHNDPVEYFREFTRQHGMRVNDDLIRTWCDESGPAFDWWEEILPPACDYDPNSEEYKTSYRSVLYWPSEPAENFEGEQFKHFSGGIDFCYESFHYAGQCIVDKCLELGVDFHYETAAYMLTQDADGQVTGVIAQDKDGNYEKYVAKKGVILCGGDWSSNDDMVRWLLPEYVEFNQGKQATGCGRDGSGCQIGIMAGGHIEEGPRGATYSMQAGLAGPLGATAFLRLNARGQRYCNEGMYGAWGQGQAAARTPGNLLCAVWDANWQDELTYQPPDHFNVDPNWGSFQGILDAMAAIEPGGEGEVPCQVWTPVGYPTYKVVCADTLDELADLVGYEGEAKENFLASVERYNELCAAGDDVDYAKEAFLLHPVEQPPFYAYASGKYFGDLVVTLSGLRIDGNQQVLDSNYEAIPGLYACGNNSGGRFILNYSTTVTGLSLGIAQLQGQVAGEYVAGL